MRFPLLPLLLLALSASALAQPHPDAVAAMAGRGGAVRGGAVRLLLEAGATASQPASSPARTTFPTTPISR